MHSFTDRQGQSWNLDLNISSAKQVRAATEVDLLNVDDGRLFAGVLTDSAKLADVLFVLCQAQAAERNISDEAFGRALAGDSIEAAADALLAEIIAFYPGHKRAALTAALAKMRSLETRMVNAAMDKLNCPETDARLDALVAGIFDRAFATVAG